ncbi:hypothetical protein FHW37_10947 [Neorhizobium alkalisoli]|uniref:Uncharacterized protein n=1 Tax=Neorhizobium alkalisoli TaxID=528178 RepID=A0A561QC83_9HYPH|nr:hypothetical protein FHW37_10947 [Neorhizobium alkalisoli]
MIRYVFQELFRGRENDGLTVVCTEKIRVGPPHGKVIFDNCDWKSGQFS